MLKTVRRMQLSYPLASHFQTSTRTKDSGEPIAKSTVTKGQELTDPSKDPASYRYTPFHNTCTLLLRDGYHESFTELFQLVEQQRMEHEKAGPAAILLPPLIEHSKEKLNLLRKGMSSAEEAKRGSDFDTVCIQLKELALECNELGDSWLSDHFHYRCLETASTIKGDNRRKEGEAHFHVSLTYEKRGQLSSALSHMLTFHQLARSHHWHTEDGNSMHNISCDHLQRIYTKMADQANSSVDSIKLLQQALAVAKEGEDEINSYCSNYVCYPRVTTGHYQKCPLRTAFHKAIVGVHVAGNTYKEGLMLHQLGHAHEKADEYDAAIQCHKGYLDRSRYHGDTGRMAEAYNALARCYEKKGDLENAVQHLELYVGVAEKMKLAKPLAMAYSAAGIMFNKLGDYAKAVVYFQQCYKLCDQLGDKEAMKDARVHCGIAQAHKSIDLFNVIVGSEETVSICKMMAWKAGRIIPTGKNDEEEREQTGAFEQSGRTLETDPR